MKTLVVEDCAEFLKCSINKVYDLINSGQLPAAKFGIRWIVTDEDLQDYVKAKIKINQEKVAKELKIREAWTNFFEMQLYPSRRRATKWLLSLPLEERLKLDGMCEKNIK